MDVGARKQLSGCINEGVHKMIVPLSSNSPLPETEVEVIIQQLIVVRAAVKDDRQGPVRVEATA